MELIRRRGMMADVRVAYAITRESNPEQMAVCYSKGWAASPDHMTVEEAEALTLSYTELRNAIGYLQNVDLRYFTNCQPDSTWNGPWTGSPNNESFKRTINGIDYQAQRCTIINYPYTWQSKGYNLTDSWRGPVYCVFVIPQNVTSFYTNTFNRGNKTTDFYVFVMESETPPTVVKWAGNTSLNITSCLREIYVPDESVSVYKEDEFWSQYADIIHPLSEYSDEWYG